MKNNEKAIAAFMANIGTITEQLAELQEYADNHMETSLEGVNWGHVGNTEKVISDLNNIMTFLGLRKETEV